MREDDLFLIKHQNEIYLASKWQDGNKFYTLLWRTKDGVPLNGHPSIGHLDGVATEKECLSYLQGLFKGIEQGRHAAILDIVANIKSLDRDAIPNCDTCTICGE